MTFRTVTLDRLEELAFESGEPIEIGTYAARLTIGQDHYRARIEPAGGAA